MSVGEEGSAVAGDLALVTLEGVRVESAPAAFAESTASPRATSSSSSSTAPRRKGRKKATATCLRWMAPPKVASCATATAAGAAAAAATSVVSASLSSAPSSAAPFSSAAATAFAAAASFGSSRDDAPLLPRGAALVNPRFVKKCSPNRALADSWSKILFQCRARSGVVQPTINEILAASQPPHASAPHSPSSSSSCAAAAGVGKQVQVVQQQQGTATKSRGRSLVASETVLDN